VIKTFFLKIVLLLFIIAAGNNVMAQTKPVKNKFKPPVVKTYLGKIFGTANILPVMDGLQIIDSSLKVVDAKGNLYTITYYQFAFKRVGVSEDDSTGKVVPESDYAADHFTTTPLPDLWRNTIKQTLTAGEDIHFFDIIVKDSKEHFFYAPQLKISFR
jgi:hypothetical protein